MSTPPPIVYALSDYEKTLLNLNKCGDSIVMGIAFVAAINHCLTETLARNALNFLQKRHPFLRAFLDEHSNLKVQLEDYETIDLEWLDADLSRNDLVTQLEEFNARLFDFKSNSNLVRSKIVSFVDESNTKMYAVNLAMALIITGKIF